MKDPANFAKFFLDPRMGSGVIKESSAYRPLLLASFALNYALGGLDVFGYHLFNFILHTLCAFLVFSITLFFLRIAHDEERLNSTGNQLTALFAASVFALHPVQTESVTYITGRSNLLTAVFFLFAFLAYMRYHLTGKIHQLFLSSFSYACALLVKETAVTLLLILVLFNLLFSLGQTWRKRIFSLSPYVLLSVIYLLIRFYFFGSLQYSSEMIRPPYENFLTQLRAWVHYLGTLLVPLNLNLDYDFPISHSVLEGGVVLSVLILASLAVVVWRISKVSRLVVFFALWFAINLLPTNSLIPLEDVVTDRWLYLPSVGFAVIVALAAEWIFRVKVRMNKRAIKLVFFFLCGLFVEFYGFATVLRNFTWTSYWTLWEDAVAKSPNKSRPHIALGLALLNARRTDEAIAEFKKAIQLDPRAGEASLNLGQIYFTQGKMEEAVQAFQKGVSQKPRLAPEVHNNLGAVYLQQGRKEEGIKELQLALKTRPLYARPYSNLGRFYEKEGDIDKAITFTERAARLEPEYLPAWTALVRLYEKKGWREKSQEARKKFFKYEAVGKRVFIAQ